MSLSALIIGHGSIGKRHAEILTEVDEISHVFVLSSQNDLSYDTINALEEISPLHPDYVVIASPTAQHYNQLKFLEDHLDGSKILVEKPLFDKKKELSIRHNEVYVGYNLRFHPMLSKIKEAIAGRKIWNIQVFCGSYLPGWRPERDYRGTSSAGKDAGGGVLLDLSHELDYVQWLAGPLKVEHAVNEKVSDLEIDSDDLLLVSGRTEKGAHVHIGLNYFTRKSTRRILIDGNGISIQGDFIANSLSQVVDGEPSEFSWPNLSRNDTYRAQHLAVLKGDVNKVCSFEEGLNTMRLIEGIRTWHN
jgi:CMP-N,N'-diacetyllegionaminic acid synthase